MSGRIKAAQRDFSQRMNARGAIGHDDAFVEEAARRTAKRFKLHWRWSDWGGIEFFE